LEIPTHPEYVAALPREVYSNNLYNSSRLFFVFLVFTQYVYVNIARGIFASAVAH